MSVHQHTSFPCPMCRQPIACPHTITLGSVDRRTGTIDVEVNLDRAAFLAAFDEHCLSDPDVHRPALRPGDDTGTADTSQEYFLDLLNRIDGLAP